MRSRRLVRAATAVTVLAAALVLAAASPATAASNPSGVRVDDAASGRAWLSWSAPSTPTGSIVGYRITPTADGTDLPAVDLESTATSAYVSDLPDGAEITFRVAAITTAGTGAASAPSTPVFLPWGGPSQVVDGVYQGFLGRSPTGAERARALDALADPGRLGDLVAALRADEPGYGSDAATVVDPVTRLYFAYFLRAPDAGGLDFWLRRKRDGQRLAWISASFAASSEFRNRYGSLSDEQFVQLVYENVLRRQPDAGGLAFWIRQLEQRRRSRGEVMTAFSESSEYRRVQATRVDVAVVWAVLARRGISNTDLVRWVDDLDEGRADLHDLVIAALGEGVGRDRWFCLPEAPTTAADQERLLNHRDDRWRIGDNARSVALPDGRVVWLFADTLYGKVNPDGSLPSTGWGYTHGSALIQDGRCIEPFYSATTDRPTSLIPDVSSTEFFWPQSGWVDRSGTVLRVIAGRRVGSPNTGGADGGTVVAEFSLPDLRFLRVTPVQRPPRGEGLSWGVALHDGDWVYVYADNGPDPEASWPFNHHAARFPDDATSFDGSGWEYWTGSGWSSRVADLRPMSFPAPKLGFTNVIRTDTGYALVTKPYLGNPPSVFAWKGPSPAGPWTEIGTVADLSSVPDNRTYAVHPETTIETMDPFIVWSQAPAASGSTAGAKVGVASPTKPLG